MDAEAAAKNLTQKALAEGFMDNITAVVCLLNQT
jgi:serine/threonine protein phosphatase PrpC